MSERKVLNKYYPADYDPSKIPRAKRPRNRQWTIRTMAPFNMRCNTCGEYIYKGKKFNSRQELAEGETYLGLKIFRFYIKCPRCVAEISFKTDPENVDYAIESGATRNFEALRTAELMAEKEAKEKEEELANNPMKMLENRTKASQREMDMLETLEDLKEVNAKHNKVNTEDMITKYRLYEEKLQELQDEEDEAFVESVFGKSGQAVVKRIKDDSESEDDSDRPGPSKIAKLYKPTDFLIEENPVVSSSSKGTDKLTSNLVKREKLTTHKETLVSNTKSNIIEKHLTASTHKKSIGFLSKGSKSNLGMLVKKKAPSTDTKIPVTDKSESSDFKLNQKSNDPKDDSKSTIVTNGNLKGSSSISDEKHYVTKKNVNSDIKTNKCH